MNPANLHSPASSSYGSPPASLYFPESPMAQRLSQGSLPSSSPGAIEIADKSCLRCRERKVRCDRLYPKCTRCHKRRENCQFADLVQVETIPASPPAENERITRLEAQLAAAELQLSQHRASLPPASPASSLGLWIPNPAEHVAGMIRAAVVEGADLRGELKLMEHVREAFGGAQLEEGEVGEGLVLLLLDAAAESSAARSRVFKGLVARIQDLKTNLSALDATSKLSVVVLSLLAIRSTPNLTFLALDPAAPGSDIGAHRENICDRLLRLALNDCFRAPETFNESWDAVEALEALVKVVIFVPNQARLILRIALGQVQDLLQAHKGLSSERRSAIAHSLISLDATLATYASKQCILTETQVREPFFADQVRIPHLGEGYRQVLEELLFAQRSNGEQPSRESIEAEIARIEACICACQRLVGSAKSVADAPERLWDAIQLVHSGIQNLQQQLSSLAILPNGCDVQAIDEFFIRSLEMDSFLVDLVFVLHLELLAVRQECRRGREAELEGLLRESEARVRKCLKLMAFCAKLYSTSHDTSLIPSFLHHLEILPSWLTLTLQRVGTLGGPQTSEFEVSSDEITWLAKALDLAAPFSTIAATRLVELTSHHPPELSSSESSPTDLLFPVTPATPFSAYDPAQIYDPPQISTYDPPAGGSVFREEWVEEPKWVGEMEGW